MSLRLLRMGYTSEVIDDEIQAYLSTSSPREIEQRFGSMAPETQKVIRAFKKLFKEKEIR